MLDNNDSEDLIVWADGTQCFRHELNEYTHMSDDYQVIKYGTPEHDQLTGMGQA